MNDIKIELNEKLGARTEAKEERTTSTCCAVGEGSSKLIPRLSINWLSCRGAKLEDGEEILKERAQDVVFSFLVAASLYNRLVIEK